MNDRTAFERYETVLKYWALKADELAKKLDDPELKLTWDFDDGNLRVKGVTIDAWGSTWLEITPSGKVVNTDNGVKGGFYVYEKEWVGENAFKPFGLVDLDEALKYWLVSWERLT